MSFTYAELFAGILGFGTALDELGGKPVFISEIDKFAQQAIRALGKGDLLHGDITKIEAAAVPDHDLLVGGFPCQAFSIGGRRLGFEDMRGTLFFEAVRIAKEKRPKVMLLENVKGLVSHAKGETISVMMHALNDIGYVVDMQILNSKFFDVPQNRERIFIVAVREDLAEVEEWQGVQGNGALQKIKRRLQEEGLVTFNFEWPQQETVTKRLRDILEPEVDEKYYLSDDKVQKLVAALEENGLQIREATTKGYAVAEPGDAVNFQFPDSKTRRGRVGKQVANTLEASGINQGVVEQLRLFEDTEPKAVKLAGIWGNRQAGSMWDVNGLSPTLKTSSGGYSEPIIDEAAASNGRQESELEQFSQGAGISYCIDASYTKGMAPKSVGKGRRTHVMETSPIYPQYRIRKLTPRETWRLQSFSDAAFDRVKDSGMSDSQLYKQAGNAVTVNVIRAIAEKLLAFLY